MSSACRRPATAAILLLVAVLALALGLPTAASAQVKLVVKLTCAGNTLTGDVTATGLAPGAVVTVQARVQTRGWSNYGPPALVTGVAGQTSYRVYIDVTGARGAKSFILIADAGSGVLVTSNTVKVGKCGPPAQVPEVPAPLVIPVSMLLTAAAAEALRRRRLGPTKA